jgi:hypothetical protein
MTRKNKERLSVKLSPERLQKLRDVAFDRDTSMTRLIEQWIDRLSEPAKKDKVVHPDSQIVQNL